MTNDLDPKAALDNAIRKFETKAGLESDDLSADFVEIDFENFDSEGDSIAHEDVVSIFLPGVRRVMKSLLKSKTLA